MKKRFLQPTVLRIIYKGFWKFFLKIFVGVNFNNVQVLKGCEQFVIVANHNSHLDTLTLMASMPSKMLWKVKPVAAKDYFGKTRLRETLSNYFINTLLIERTGAKTGVPIEQMVEALDAGYSIIIFPEGTRGTTGRIDKLKSGVAQILSLRPHVKYVPVYLTGMGKSLPKGEFLILPYKSSINFGEVKLVQDADRKSIIEQIAADLDELEIRYNSPLEDD